MHDVIYLDWAAHTPADDRVLRLFCEAEYGGNPLSGHSVGREAQKRLDDATAQIAELLHVDPGELIHTSGASEANNTAIKGFARAGRHVGKHIISTALEHPSVSGPLTALQEQGYEIDLVNIGRDGRVDCEHLQELCRSDTVLVAVSAVDSELGTVQPIEAIVDIVKDYPQCRLHVDAVQAIGKMPFSFDGIHSASISPHKFFGLTGCGLLWKQDRLAMEPLIHGGASSTIYRSGTPAVSLAAATAHALSLAHAGLAAQWEHISGLNQQLRRQLSAYPLVRINSPKGAIPHILNVSVKGIKARDFQEKLDQNGVCVSVKSACSTPNTPSRAVFAVSRDRQNALSSWRISMSRQTTQEEIAEFLERFDQIYREIS